MKNTEHWYTTATNTILQHGRFSYSIGLVLYVWLCQCWSSLDWKIFTDVDEITLSGNEFQLFITLLLKQCYRIVLLHLSFSSFRLTSGSCKPVHMCFTTTFNQHGRSKVIGLSLTGSRAL